MTIRTNFYVAWNSSPKNNRLNFIFGNKIYSYDAIHRSMYWTIQLIYEN